MINLQKSPSPLEPDLMLKLLPIILALLLPGMAKSQGVEFPAPPNGQVFDPAGWLGADRIIRLENELSRYQKNHQVDVFVVLWSRSLPPRTTLEELAVRLGETWSQQPLWAVVLHLPESLHRPVVVSRNTSGPLPGEQFIDDARQSAVSRGMKEPHTRARIESLALEIGEELIFCKNRELLEQTTSTTGDSNTLPQGEQLHRPLLPPAIVLIFPALLLIVISCRFHQRSASLTFPARTWRRRLNASWGGANPITVSIPPRSP